MKQRLTILITIFFHSIYLQGQYTPKLYNYNITNGLPSNEAYYVIQDSKGFIWCSTDHGVVRYNGESFKLFSIRNGLTDQAVFDLFEDHLGRIWCLTFNKKLCYIENDSVISFPFNNKIQEHISNNKIPSNLLVDTAGTVSISFKSYGVLSISETGETNFIDANTLLLDKVSFYLFTKNSPQKTIIAEKSTATPPNKKHSSMIIYNNQKRTKHKPVISPNPIVGVYKTSACQYQNHSFYSYSNILYYHREDTIQEQSFNDNIISLYSDGKYLWIGFYRKGVSCYQIESGQLIEKQHLLGQYSISSICKDNKGGYWFTSLDNGLFYVANLAILTWSLSRHSQIAGIDGNTSSEVYVLHENGILNVIKNNTKQTFELENRNVSSNALLYDSINNQVYLTSDHLYAYSPKTKTLKPLFQDKRTLISKTLLLDNTTLWSSGRTSIKRISLHSDEPSIVYENYNLKIDAISLYNDSSLIIANENTLFQYHSNTLTPLNWLDAYSNPISINSLAKFKEQYIVGTENSGLLFIEQEAFKFKLDKSSGLISNQIHCIYPLSNTELLIGTDLGITLIKTDRKEFQFFNLERFEGLLESQVTAIFSRQDSIWVAHQEGISKFHKEVFFLPKSTDQVLLEKIWINDSIHSNLTLADTLIFPYHKNRIEFKFLPNNYRQTKHWYKYKLEGEDRVWKTSQDPFVVYSSLAPGFYTFNIAVSPNNKDYGAFKKIFIQIYPPFWTTWWFILLVLAIGFGIIYACVRYNINSKIKKIKAQELIKQQMFELKSVALKAQINPHFFFNVLSSLQGGILTEPSEVAYNYHNKFTQLMRLVLMQSDEQSILIQKEIKALKLYIELEQFRTNNAFNAYINIAPTLENANLYVPSMLLQPLVENAIWHGVMNRKDNTNKEVNISIQKKENYLECIIEDNGVGRAEAMKIRAKKIHQHQSMGAKISHRRLEIYKQQLNLNFRFEYEDLVDVQGNALGTRVLISFPYFTSKNKK